jgi:trehalose 6-phosphate phosphatase
MSALPRPATAAGRAGLDALLADPGGALIGSDFDGTLSPIVPDPEAAYAHPGAVAALRRLAGKVGTVAIITGRPVEQALRLGGLSDVPGLIVLGHYGWERWESGQVSAPAVPAGVAVARGALPGVLHAAGAPARTRTEDKGYALAVHTRGTDDPNAALELLRAPLEVLAAEAGLTIEPGRMVIELRPPGIDKGAALTELVAERGARSVMFCGDDLGDLPAFAAVRALRAHGLPGLAVCSASPESARPEREADLVVDGPDGIAALLTAIADHISA